MAGGDHELCCFDLPSGSCWPREGPPNYFRRIIRKLFLSFLPGRTNLVSRAPTVKPQSCARSICTISSILIVTHYWETSVETLTDPLLDGCHWLPDDESAFRHFVFRFKGRRTTATCNRPFSIISLPPKEAVQCDWSAISLRRLLRVIIPWNKVWPV